MSQNVARLFDPAGQPGSATVWQVVYARLEHLALRVQSGEFGRENYENHYRSLTRFAQAWSVTLSDGRHFLAPIPEKQRRQPLEFAAATEEAAVAQAIRQAAVLMPGPGLGTLTGAARNNGARAIEECSNDDLSRWQIANPQWRSGHTKSNNLVAIVDCFAWWEDEKGVKNPFKRRRLPKFIKPSRREATDEEYIALMRGGSRPLRRILFVLYNFNGIRTCEQREMLWTDIDFGAGMALLYKHKAMRATGKPKPLPLTPRMLKFFQNLHKQHRPEDAHVFLNCEGTPWTRRSLGLHLRRTAARLGLDVDGMPNVTAYCFRHTFSTQSDEAGVPEEHTIKLMGHSGSRMHRTVYSKASKKTRYLRDIAEKTEQARRQARKAQAKPAKPKVDPPTPLFDGLE